MKFDKVRPTQPLQHPEIYKIIFGRGFDLRKGKAKCFKSVFIINHHSCTNCSLTVFITKQHDINNSDVHKLNYIKYTKVEMTWSIFHGRAGIRILSSIERYFQHSKIKFVSPSGHEMFCLLYRY